MQKITSAGKIAHHSGATNGKKKSRAFVWYLIRLWGSLTAGDLTFVVAMVWLHDHHQFKNGSARRGTWSIMAESCIVHE